MCLCRHHRQRCIASHCQAHQEAPIRGSRMPGCRVAEPPRLVPHRCLARAPFWGPTPPHIGPRVSLSGPPLGGAPHSACEPGARRARPRATASMGLWLFVGITSLRSHTSHGCEFAAPCVRLLACVVRVVWPEAYRIVARLTPPINNSRIPLWSGRNGARARHHLRPCHRRRPGHRGQCRRRRPWQPRRLWHRRMRWQWRRRPGHRRSHGIRAGDGIDAGHVIGAGHGVASGYAISARHGVASGHGIGAGHVVDAANGIGADHARHCTGAAEKPLGSSIPPPRRLGKAWMVRVAGAAREPRARLPATAPSQRPRVRSSWRRSSPPPCRRRLCRPQAAPPRNVVSAASSFVVRFVGVSAKLASSASLSSPKVDGDASVDLAGCRLHRAPDSETRSSRKACPSQPPPTHRRR